MKKNNEKPTVPPKHVRRAEFYKRLKESSICNNSKKKQLSFEEIAELSQEVDKKAVEIESPNNQEYEERVMKRELETRRHPFIIDIDNDELCGR